MKLLTVTCAPSRRHGTGVFTQENPVKILITSGASCPDAVVEKVINRLIGFFPIEKTIGELTEEFV